MGYQVTFKPSAEKMDKDYKPWNYDKPSYAGNDTDKINFKASVLELIMYVMKGKHGDNITNLYKAINYHLRYFRQHTYDETKRDAYDRWKSDENGELWYCGWNFAEPSRLDDDDVIDNTTEQLVILADIVDTPDYFDDHEKWWEKYRTVSEEINGFIDLMREQAIHGIIEDLDEFKCTYDDDKYDDEIPESLDEEPEYEIKQEPQEGFTEGCQQQSDSDCEGSYKGADKD